MRITIIPTDGFVSIDGVGYCGLDLSLIDPSIHAIQWYGSQGEVEIRNTVTNKMLENREITSIDEFEPAITAWNAAKEAELLASQKIDTDLQVSQETETLGISEVNPGINENISATNP